MIYCTLCMPYLHATISKYRGKPIGKKRRKKKKKQYITYAMSDDHLICEEVNMYACVLFIYMQVCMPFGIGVEN